MRANLHLHLTGSMRLATLAQLADRERLPLPEPLAPNVIHPWEAFQQRYDLARSVLRSHEDVARVAAEAVEDDARCGATWTEIQVDPTSLAPLLGGLEAVVEAVLAGVRGKQASVIVASSWARPPAHAEMLAALAARYADQGVTGFGLSFDERLGRVADFAPAAAIASRAGLMIVPHAGFYEPAWHVAECVRLLGAHRIGHGITAADDPAVLELLAERGVTIELCPTSYPPLGVAASLAQVPLRAFMSAGVPVALGTDDPLLFGGSLDDQYAIARDHLGCTEEELALLARQSISASAANHLSQGQTSATVQTG
ncbi:putative adenosine/adenine deaminase [Rhizocola hellebori]|uniref:Putative adenosine/adenine deaminase n=1 Tax=Rhizocola hellebori TaxID=1392758 RepID=A0A8J3VLN0_9ACTN|nr:adenosine deaminase [Rhizocola hellebori]GIH10842.1 putative adenosine/adenine deaminase [Rhizocola hellebori]